MKVVQRPVYCHKDDGLLGLAYEAVLRGMDLSCFPSFYEPWGYTPEESLAVGVPTVTTDLAGFGRWARGERLAPADGVYVLERDGVEFGASVERLTGVIESFFAEERDVRELAATCRDTARLTAWSDLIARYYEAFDRALAAADKRAPSAAPRAVRATVAVSLVPSAHGERPRLSHFDVSATIPPALRGLERLARNYWWSWDPEAPALFRALCAEKWDAGHHDVTRFLRDIYPEDLTELAANNEYVARLKQVLARFDAYMAGAGRPFPLGGGAALTARNPIAYFCAEFGIHESLKIYSGGLGILAGDHLKSASDLNLPLVAVGLFYCRGYIAQKLTAAGEQISTEAENDPRNLPLELVLDDEKKPLEIELSLPSSRLLLRAWKVDVGRVSLYLLDSNVAANRPEDRDITRQLYGGDHEVRLRQEIVLGRGGVRLLARLGIDPAVFHINEGHAAFLAVERVGRYLREQGLTFDEAREIVRSSTVFTTHTPVPAGHDRFSEDLMRRYFSDVPQWLGVPWERFFALGGVEDDRREFNMTYLALGFAGFANGVSQLHGEVSRRLLRAYWPRLLEGEVPVRSITNGVHLPTWTDPEVQRIVGARDRAVSAQDFERAARSIDERALWSVKQSAKQRMLEVIRARLEESFFERGDSPSTLSRMLAGLRTDCLWLGFARRFAPYKRAQLILRDPARLKALLHDPDRPLRIVFAGKAHPNDKLGQEILKQVAQAKRSDEFLGKIFFVNDYDIELARALVQGVDAWLNNPIRPLEASGTSGMKVAANGGLNLSVLDGWWVEAHDGRNGWSIGGGRVAPSQELQDELDGDHLYRLLEEELLPMYFERDEGGLPREWLARVKHNLATIPPHFNSDRMVGEYCQRAYAPLAAAWFERSADRGARARALAQRHAFVRRGFADVKIQGAHIADLTSVQVGDRIDVRVDVDLGPLSVEDVVVELVLGHVNGGDLRKPIFVALDPVATAGARSAGTDEAGRGAINVHAFEGAHQVQRSGSFAYGIRVRARSAGELDTSLADLVLWA